MDAMAIQMLPITGWAIWLRKPPKATELHPHKGKADPIWDTAVSPKFKTPVVPISEAPFGTAKSLGALGSFLDKVAEIDAIRATQRYELATTAQELAMHGLKSTSLSSPAAGADDDADACNIAITDKNGTPYTFNSMDPEETALLRRIEWERYIFACGPAAHIYAKMEQDGSRSIGTEAKWLSREQVAAYAPTIRRLIGDRDMADVLNARARAYHYGKPVLADMSEEEYDDWAGRGPRRTEYLDATDDTDRTPWEVEDYEMKRDLQGKAEIGFQTYDRSETGFEAANVTDPLCFVTHETIHLAVDFEPSDIALWPEDAEEGE